MTQVVNYKTCGLAHDGVVIQRSSIYGNPFPVCRTRTRAQALQAFEAYARARVAADPGFAAAVLGLRGRTLLCGCKPLPCHGDVLVAQSDELALTV